MTDRDAHLQLILNTRDGYTSSEVHWICLDQYKRILDILYEDDPTGVLRGPEVDLNDDVVQQAYEEAIRAGACFVQLREDGTFKVLPTKEVRR